MGGPARAGPSAGPGTQLRLRGPRSVQLDVQSRLRCLGKFGKSRGIRMCSHLPCGLRRCVPAIRKSSKQRRLTAEKVEERYVAGEFASVRIGLLCFVACIPIGVQSESLLREVFRKAASRELDLQRQRILVDGPPKRQRPQTSPQQPG